jgi:hypothetical protein
VTAARAAVRPAVRAVRALDRAIGRLRRRRTVLIEARTPMNLAVLWPVVEPLLQDPRIRVRFTGPDREDLRHAFDELHVRDRVIPRGEVSWLRVDLYVNSDPWEAVPLWRAGKQLNFFHGVAGKYNLDCPADLPIGFERYDRVAFPNEGRRDNYVAAGIVPAERAVLIGYPKADVLITESGNARAAAAALGLDPSRPTAVFAPTFSPASSLNHAGDEIIRTLLATGCNVIAKLHDRSLDPDPRYTGGVNWRSRLRAYAGPHFLLAGSGDSTSYVLASDLMVTDHSSIGFEFCALDRPLIVYDVPQLIELARINPDKVALLRSAATVVADTAALAAAVADALASPGARSPERRRASAEVFYRPGGATARALRLVYELLDLHPAAAFVASRRPRALSAAK